MNKATFFSGLVLFFLLGLFACNDEEAARQKEEERRQEELEESLSNMSEELGNISENLGESITENMGGALEQLGKSLKDVKIETDQDVELIPHRELKEFIPNKFAGVDRTDYKGQTSGIGNIKVSVSEAEFREDDQRIDLKVMDTGGLGVALMGAAFWQNLEIDQESSNGYERTTTFEGHKAFEKYNSSRKKGEMAIIVKDRFVVTCNFRNMDIDDVKRAIKRMDIEDLGD